MKVGGYIKIDRKIMDWEWYKNINTKALFLHCLLKANWKDGKFEGKLIKRGSFITSIKKLSNELCLTEDEIRTAMKHLIFTGELTKQTTNKYTVITVSNYELYQDVTEQIPVNSQTDTEQIPNNSHSIPKLFPTIEEGKNIKREEEKKKDILTVSNKTVCHADIQQIVEKWNTLSEYGIKPISRLHSDSKRYKCLASRLNEYGKEEVVRAIENIKKSNFLQGKESGSSWVITFDWFVLPSNFPKVLDGNYENRQATKKKRIVDNNNFERRKYDMSDLEKKLLINKNN